MAFTPSATLDPCRLQLLRQLQSFLSDVTSEFIQEHGDNYDRQKRNDKFYNTVKIFADRVVELKEKKETLRTPLTASPSTVGNHASLQTSPSSNTSGLNAHSGAAPVSNSTGLANASLPRHWGLSDFQGRQGSPPGVMPGSITRASVSPSAPPKEASFSSIPSLQSSRVQSSESVPTVETLSASQSSSMGAAPNTQGPLSSTSTSPLFQQKQSTNFGIAPLPRKEPSNAMSTLQRHAISTTAVLEQNLGMFHEAMNSSQNMPGVTLQPATAARLRQQLPISVAASDDAAEGDHSRSAAHRKRKRQKKQWCHMCNDHKEGFRGPHELQRHINIQHQTKKTVFIVFDDSPDGNKFKDCKHCSRRKIYGQDYNAACHLRRAHFNKRQKTETAEEREHRQLHADHPPMEELRPWLRKCLVDVSKLNDPKYIDKQDDAILKIESAAKVEDTSSSDHDKSDDEVVQPVAPATPPQEPTDAEAEAEPQSAFNDISMGDFMGTAFGDWDFPAVDTDFDFDNTGPLDTQLPSSEFALSQDHILSQQAATPRVSNINNVEAHLRMMGYSVESVDPDTRRLVGNTFFNNAPNFEPPYFSGNMQFDPMASGNDFATEDFDFDNYLNPGNVN